MMQSLPKVIPINELKNTARMTQTCKESQVPIIVTKNGYGEMVLMSIPLYEKTMAQARAAGLSLPL
ncbi:MAG: type II toxin-antitoxin system Phd/YefM family antitoxin [Akkermansia sp.]|nr:type II toxin-antitoxin system Phd/YefM family antitoxin [Akkermansia sp.]